MRYTRYNYKKSKNNDLFRFILKLVGTVVGAGICGITLAYVAFSILTKNNELPAGNRGKETSIEANSNEIVLLNYLIYLFSLLQICFLMKAMLIIY